MTGAARNSLSDEAAAAAAAQAEIEIEEAGSPPHLLRNHHPLNKATSLRKREVILSRISIYIVFVFLFCHSLRIIPNVYEMICTYTKVHNTVFAIFIAPGTVS